MAQKHNSYEEKPMTRYGSVQGPSRRYRRLRHPTFPAAEWADKNPLLQRGEIGYEVDTHHVKVGDGITYWNDLPYIFDDAGQPLSTADYQMGNAQGGWTTMSQAQQDALNSGATTAKINQIATNTTNIGNHIADTNNPHSVTKAQVGLGNVDNTSDLDKPISTATQTALDSKADKTNRVNGAPLSNATSNFYGTSDTAAATVQKEVSIPSITSLDTGTVIFIQPTVTSTVANSILKLNNFDAYPMRYNNAAITTSTDSVVWNANYISIFVFDGTYWQFAGHGLDSNTTYTLNYSVDAGQYTAGSGSYAVTRYSILAQKADGTWEKITATNASYSTATSKSVNTSGFILNQLRYYGTTTAVAGGVKIATNVLYEKAASVDMRYSTNCGGTTTWALGDYIYLVGTIGADGLFYLDTTQWWTNALPATNDGKLYIRLGMVLSAAGYTMSLFDDRPIFYHDGTGIKEYKVADNKQDVISDLATIRSGASAGATAVQPGDLATVATSGSYNDLLNKPTIPTVNDATLTIQKNGTTVNTFTANASSNVTANITVPTDTNDLTNGAGYITGINSTDVTNALGYTPVDPSNLATVATTGDYDDLLNKPTIPAAQVNADWNANSGVAEILNKPTLGTMAAEDAADYTPTSGLASVATSGDYDDLLNKPTIPTVNDATLTIQKNGTNVATFTANASSAVTANISVPTDTNDLTNGAGYITGITSSDVITALGYTPYSDANPNGYTSNVGTVTSVNNTSPDGSGNVSLTIPTVNNPTIIITQGGVTKGSFTLNQASGDTIALDAGGGGSVAIDNSTITKNSSDEIQAVATINANSAAGATNPIYDWVGTLAEYTSQAIATNHPDWVCYITDDLTSAAYDAYSKSQTDALLANKADAGHEVIEFQAPNAGNNYTWYRKYADGWVEQGGTMSARSSNSSITAILPVEMADVNYSVNSTTLYAAGGSDVANQVTARTTTSVSIFDWNGRGTIWEVKGMAA
jgi:hypothetical protein